MKVPHVVFTLAAMFATFGYGQDQGTAFIESRFRRFDTNGDGKLSAVEAKPLAELLEGADTDGDGAFTLPEVLAHIRKNGSRLAQLRSGSSIVGLIAPEIEERFKKVDANGDGKVEGDELRGAPWLLRLDVNGDRVVTLEEATKFFASFVQPEAPVSAKAPPMFEPGEDSPRQEAKVLKATDHRIGEMIPEMKFKDVDGKEWSLGEFTTGKATVVALMSPSCPVSKRYLPSIAVLEKEFAGKGVKFLLVAPLPVETPAELKAAAKAAGVEAVVVPDAKGEIAASFGAMCTTDVFVLDEKRTLKYRGAIDDQYGLGYSLDAPRVRYVKKALDAVLAGGLPAVAATEAPGCVLDLGKAKGASLAGGVTFHNRISRLLQMNCQECHRSGGVAPFALETYEQVTAKAGMVRRMVERGLMPPWFATAPEKGHSPWINDRSLSERDKTDLLAWLDGGKPAGDAKDAPLPRTWPTEWKIGTPEVIVQIPQPMEVQATGTMPYKHVNVPTNFGEDKWLQAFEVKPTAPEVVHHVLVFVREGGPGGVRAGRLVSNDDETGGFFAAYVPGNDHVYYPDGFAKPLPKNAVLRFQIHYTPNGVATKDQVRLGMIFAKEPPKHVVNVAGIANLGLRIPPGANNHPASANIPVPKTVNLMAFTPHMHLRGKAFRYEVILPNGDVRTLLEIPRYDFNWQLSYRFATPVTIPAGSKIRATGWFDNSPSNPANPDPTKIVKWGPQTFDEMMLGYVEYYYPEGDPAEQATAAR